MMIADCNHHRHQPNQRTQQQVTMLSSTVQPANTSQCASNQTIMLRQHPNSPLQQQQQQPTNNCRQEIAHQHQHQQQHQMQQHYGQHEAGHQAPQVQYIEASNNNNNQSQQNHSQQQQTSSNYSPQQQQQLYTRPISHNQQLCHQMQQGHHHHHPQQQQHLQLITNVNAPPTPPSDDHLQQTATTVYLAPHDNRQQIQSSKLQTGAWVMQTIQIQQQQQQYKTELQDTTTSTQQQQPTTIGSYYYDIDDGFSDILSAPATPEPMHMNMIAADPSQQAQQQQQQLNDNYQHDYSNYLPYNNTSDSNRQPQMLAGSNNVQLDFENHQNHHHLQQQQQEQHFYPTQVLSTRHSVAQVPYTIAMSPDSSSLSTTSSSPSDHSLYQASPPMPNCLINNGSGRAPLQAAVGPAVQPATDQHLKRHYNAGQLLSHSPPIKSEQQTYSPICQQQQPANTASNNNNNNNNQISQVILKPINNGGQQVQRRHNEQQQQQRPLGQTQQPTVTPTQHQHLHHHHHHHRSSPIHLWEFLKELLQQVELGSADSTIIRWLDRQRGVFKIEDSVQVAKLWGKRKNKPKMNYDKLSRSIRQYYKKGIMKKTDRSQRLVYQFCSAYCH